MRLETYNLQRHQIQIQIQNTQIQSNLSHRGGQDKHYIVAGNDCQRTHMTPHSLTRLNWHLFGPFMTEAYLSKTFWHRQHDFWKSVATKVLLLSAVFTVALIQQVATKVLKRSVESNQSVASKVLLLLKRSVDPGLSSHSLTLTLIYRGAQPAIVDLVSELTWWLRSSENNLSF